MSDYEQSVFISYAWGTEREDIVNEIDETLQQRGIRIVRDKRALGYRGSIKDFMERIGRGSCVIVVISDKYLRSPNCMFELVEIAENKQFYDRVFPIILSDANIYDPIKRIEYVKFWEAKRKELAKAMKTLDPANLHGIREDMDQYDRIRDKISGITSILKDMNTLTPDMHRDSEFSNLYDAIIERLRESSTDVTDEFNEITKKADREAKADADRLTAQKAEEERIAKAKAEADRKSIEETDRIAAQKAEAERLAQQRAEEERLAIAKAEADRLAAQKVEAERLAQQRAEEERLAKAKAEADHIATQKAEEERLAAQRVEEQRLAQAKAEADRLAGKKAVDERLAQQKAEEERLTKAKADREAQAEADRKAKEEADRLAAQKAEAERLAQQKTEEERKAKEKVIPVAAKVAPVPVAPVQKKPASKGLVYGIGAVVLLAVVGIGFSVLNGGNKNAPVSTPTTQAAVVVSATVAPTLASVESPTLVSAPIGGGTGKIAFVSDRDGNAEIYTMNVDGSGVTRLTNNTAGDFGPAWSPDGKYIAFTSKRDEPNPTTCAFCGSEIYIMNADGSGQINVTNNGASNTQAAWSPDGKYIAFMSEPLAYVYDIYVMNADGSEQFSLVTDDAYDGSPAWSPDGKHILFETNRVGGDYYTSIFIMNADGSGPTNMTSTSDGGSPAWSLDSNQIAFTCAGDICVMNADGSGVTKLMEDGDQPSWSPDSKYIAFSSNRDGNDEIYIMNADGSGVTRVTNNTVDDNGPAWQPTTAVSTSTSSLGIGSTIISEKDGMTLLYVPAGEFTMGSNDWGDDEKPLHKVDLDAFWIDKTEVTNKMYALCVTAGFCQEPGNKSSATHSSYYGNSDFDNYPVIYVEWNMAKAYCEWAGRRLPTEAEWEKSARGTDPRNWPWGFNVPDNNLLNYDGAVGDTTEVGKYPNGASPYGTLDMAGNVSEWVADWFDPNYYSTLGDNARNPQGPANGDSRLLRGGGWNDRYFSVRSASRDWSPPASDTFVGFRCAMTAAPTDTAIVAPTLSPSVSRPTIDGLASETEWVQATVYDLPHGKSYYQNDDDYLYILIDMIGDTVDDARSGSDSVQFAFDVNENKVVDADKDIRYSFYGASGDYSRFMFSYYAYCGAWTGGNPSNSEGAAGFGPSFSTTIPHRIWEFAFALDEIQATPGQKVRFGINTASGYPSFRDNIPESFSEYSCDFSELVEIDLERP